ncbi:MAG: hypothetical protein JWR38_1702 [Mucilaginibacter sp.]|nr:hypothetical protein [Mucilaginibacter sp.]
MKVIKSRRVSTIMERFDNELKTLLVNDLKAIRAITTAKSAILNGIPQATSLSIA